MSVAAQCTVVQDVPLNRHRARFSPFPPVTNGCSIIATFFPISFLWKNNAFFGNSPKINCPVVCRTAWRSSRDTKSPRRLSLLAPSLDVQPRDVNDASRRSRGINQSCTQRKVARIRGFIVGQTSTLHIYHRKHRPRVNCTVHPLLVNLIT